MQSNSIPQRLHLLQASCVSDIHLLCPNLHCYLSDLLQHLPICSKLRVLRLWRETQHVIQCIRDHMGYVSLIKVYLKVII